MGNLDPGPGWRRTVLLANGKVLFAGGPKAELYDPATGIFTATGAYAAARRGESVSAATLLTDGRVLITGWATDCAAPELYDPVTGTFSLSRLFDRVRQRLRGGDLASQRKGPICGQP